MDPIMLIMAALGVAGAQEGWISGTNRISHARLIDSEATHAKAAWRRRRRAWDHLNTGNRADRRQINGVAAAQSHDRVNSPARILKEATWCPRTIGPRYTVRPSRSRTRS